MTRNPITFAAAAAFVVPVESREPGGASTHGATSVAPLPPPPRNGENLMEVLPYLVQLAAAERTLSWRIAAAFTCMLASKAAGVHAHCVCQLLGLLSMQDRGMLCSPASLSLCCT